MINQFFTSKIATGVLLMTGISVILSGCADNAQPAVTPQPSAEKGSEQHSPVGAGNTQGKDYTTDVMRFATGSAEFGTWGQCLAMSSWAAEAASGKYTFLCPTETSLREMERTHLSEFKRPENKKLLDRTIAANLIKGQFQPADLMLQSTVETIDGQIYKIDKDARTVGGVVATQRFVASPTLYLIVTEDLINYPVVELKASVARNESKGGASGPQVKK